MLSETMDSPSSYTDEHFIHDERQDGFWKTNAVNKVYGTKSNGLLSPFAASPLEKDILMNSQIRNGFAPQDSYLSWDQRANPSSERFTSISEKGASMSLPRGFQHIIGSASYNTEGDKVNFTGARYENGLFSSSLSELFSRKLRLSSTNTPFGHSVGATEPHKDEEPFESLKELEAQTIGDLLPDDDEELFSGVADGINRNACLINGDETEEDLFCSVGGLELGEDGDINSETLSLNSNSQLRGCNGASRMQHPSGEHPSRTLFVRNIDSNVEDSELQSLFQQYGDIRTLYTGCKHRGFVMISYYDIRAAWNAMKVLQKKPLQNRNLDIHFSIPKDTPEKDVNQGTLEVFNLDSSVSNDKLHQIFGVYGEIKKIYEVPRTNSRKFIEFYDVRAAAAALQALKKTDIGAKRISLEPSLPGVARRSMYAFPSELDQENSSIYQQQSIPPSNFMTGLSGSISLGGMASNLDNGSVVDARFSDGLPMSPYRENEFLDRISASVPNRLPSLLSVGSTGHIANSIEASNSLGQLKFNIQGTPSFHRHSFSDHHKGLGANGPANIGGRSPELLEKPFGTVNPSGHHIGLNANVFNNGSPGQQHYLRSNTPKPQSQGIIWPNSPSFVNGACSPLPQQMHTIARAPSHLSSGFIPISNHHVGSAPSINPSVLERRNVFAAKSQDPSVFNPGSVGTMRIPGGSPHFMEFIPHNVFSCNGGSIDLPTPKNLQMHPQNQRCMMVPGRGQMVSMMSSYDSPSERTRSRRNEGSSSQGDRKQFELDIDRIMRGEDKRATLMIKNIPNKYTSKMLLAAIDERHRGSYDFLYLPIDFKNKCNVGYAFINMTEPTLIVPFYQALNGRKWEKFNSEKVASLAYARIQGKVALISHFQNSSLMNEDKRCRPILFHTDGPNAGDQVPFPMGVNIRPRGGNNRSNTSVENNQENPPNSLIDEESSNEKASVSD